jgi:hypothetical protein
MARSTIKNPLLGAQREKAGAQTFAKYAYQYHWALFKVLKEHEKGNEYAVFVEMHEDVVISDSLDGEDAKFDFNQVKTTKGRFTKESLTKLKKGSSVLGKLLSNYNGRPFSSKISKLNLVSVNGFSLALKDDTLELMEIGMDDLEDSCVSHLAEAIKKELTVDPLPANLHFVVPGLPDVNFQDLIIAEISTMIDNLYPGANFNSVAIYRALYDDISRKGMITYDIQDWDKFLHCKALTSSKVAKVINQFTSLKDEGRIQSKFNQIVAELGLNSIKAKNLESAFNRYRQSTIGNRSVLQLDTAKELSILVREAVDSSTDDWGELFKYVEARLSTKAKDLWNSSEAIKAAIIYEFIIQE